MSNWKFKVGDVVKDGEGFTYVINSTCLDYGVHHYMLTNEFGKTIKSMKAVVEELCELVKPKSLYEQVLELVGLKIGDRFLINCSEFEVNSDNIYFVLNNKRSKIIQCKESNFGLEKLLFNKDEISKPKSEAELILDELEKVVNKAKAVLERSGR